MSGFGGNNFGLYHPAHGARMKAWPADASPRFDARRDALHSLLAEAVDRAAKVHNDQRLSLAGKRIAIADANASLRSYLVDFGKTLNAARGTLSIMEKHMDATNTDPVVEIRCAGIRDYLAKANGRSGIIEKVISDATDAEALRAIAETPAVRTDVVQGTQRERALAALRALLFPDRVAEHRKLSIATDAFEDTLKGAASLLDEMETADEAGMNAILARRTVAARAAGRFAELRGEAKPDAA